jgi:competence protein ComEA
MKRLILILALWVACAGAALAAVNINTATKEELTSIKGVGAGRAQDIIDYRTKNGPFKSVDDLEKVPGVGPGLMKRIRSQVTTSGSSTAVTPAPKATTMTTTKTPAAKSEGLKADRASGKIAEKLTTGTKAEKKKSK